MIDHLAIDVSDLAKRGRFYDQALAPLGHKKLSDAPVDFGGRLTLGWTDPLETELYIGVGSTTKPRLHIAFRAKNRQQVDDFYHAALAAGGIHNGKPGLRPQYHENYYGAYVLDPDGHNVEAVCHGGRGAAAEPSSSTKSS